VESKVSALREVLPLIGRIPDRLEQNLRLKSLAERFGIEELFLRSELSNSKKTQGREAIQEPGHAAEAKWLAEERLACNCSSNTPF